MTGLWDSKWAVSAWNIVTGLSRCTRRARTGGSSSCSSTPQRARIALGTERGSEALPPIAQSAIVFFRAALITVAFDSYRAGRIGLQAFGHGGHLRLLAGFDDRTVIVEMDRIGFEHFRVFNPALMVGGIVRFDAAEKVR